MEIWLRDGWLNQGSVYVWLWQIASVNTRNGGDGFVDVAG